MDRVWEAFGGWNNNEHKVDGNDNNNFIACLFMSTHYAISYIVCCIRVLCFHVWRVRRKKGVSDKFS